MTRLELSQEAVRAAEGQSSSSDEGMAAVAKEHTPRHTSVVVTFPETLRIRIGTEATEERSY